MIVRDGQGTIPLALTSLLTQTYPNWECIVVNDASQDGTRDLLEKLNDPRFQVKHYRSPLGRGRARNEALECCRGKYLATLDCDDFYFTDTLAQHVEALEADPELAASVGPLLLFDHNEKLIGRLRRQPKPGCRHIPDLPYEIKLPFGSMVFRRSVLEGYRFNPQFNRSEDRDLYSRVLPGKRVLVLDQPTYAYRWSLELNKVLAGLKENEQIYAVHLRRSPLRSILLIAANRLKRFSYQILGYLGLWNKANRLRFLRPSSRERERFLTQLAELRAHSVPM